MLYIIKMIMKSAIGGKAAQEEKLKQKQNSSIKDSGGGGGKKNENWKNYTYPSPFIN